jgi:DNA-binding transcriptional ArsR family regulator
LEGEQQTMANKKTKNQIDSIRDDVTALTEAVWALRDQLTFEVAAAAAARSATSISPGYAGLGGQAGPTGNGQGPSRVDMDERISELSAVDEDAAAQVLHALGHRQRLGIIRSLVERPSSAADLVDALNLGTTGAAYHHLNVLLAANVVVQQSRGVYSVDERRLPGVLHLLAGAAATIDPALPLPEWQTTGAEDEVLAERSSV